MKLQNVSGVMQGIINIDKPADWTSHDVVAKLRGALKIKRIGHGGTLDPMATGVLPIFVGNATRCVEFCESFDKEYIAGLKLGIVTDTQDITGNTLRVSDATVSESDLLGIFDRFIGEQKQVPPMFSAVKIGGKKLYELARRGVEIDRPARDIVIHGIELLEPSLGDCSAADFLLKVSCSKGTYIRTLMNDIGEVLGCGGVLSSLTRTKAGMFHIDNAFTLNDVLSAAGSGSISDCMMQTDIVFSEHPPITLTDTEARRCLNGAPCHIASSYDGVFRFYDGFGEFLFLGEVERSSVSVIKRFVG